MVDSAVNKSPIGKHAVLHRPPSGSSRSRSNFKPAYAKELSKTTQKNSKLFHSPSTNQQLEGVGISYTAGNEQRSNRLVTRQLINDTAGSLIEDAKSLSKGANSSEERLHSKPRRVQSAKGRLSQVVATGDALPVGSRGVKSKRQRPASAHVLGENKSRPSKDSDEARNKDNLLPFVYGYKSQRKICGSDSDLQKCGKEARDTEYPYRLNIKKEDAVGENVSTDLVNCYEEDEYEDITGSFPQNLKPLLPWLTLGIPQKYTGVDPADCLVFLPSFCTQDTPSLPTVPQPPGPCEELPYKEKILPPKPRDIKKYDHPWRKRPLEEWQCKHTRAGMKEAPSLLRVYGRDGHLLHESSGNRTISVVRREIQELEDLLKGVGDDNGYSIIVQYQAEINKIQEMLHSMSGRLQEIDKREAEKEAKARQAETDYCGLRAFYKDHEEVIAQIQRQHALCVKELAALETDLGLSSERAHFRNQKPLPCVNIA